MKSTDTKHVAIAINNAAEQFANAKTYEEKYNFFQLWLTLVADAASQPSNPMEKRNEQLIKNANNALIQMEKDLGNIVDVPSKIDMLNVIFTSINTPYGKSESVDKAINNISNVIEKYGEKIKEEASQHNKKVESEKLQQQSAEINDELYEQAKNVDGKVKVISSAINIKHNSQLLENEINKQKHTLTEKTNSYQEEAHKTLFLDTVYQGVKASKSPSGEFGTIVSNAEKVVQEQIDKELEKKRVRELEVRKNNLKVEYHNQIEGFNNQIKENKNNPKKTESLLGKQLDAKLGVQHAESFIQALEGITTEEQIGEKTQEQQNEKVEFNEAIKKAFPNNAPGKEKFVEAMFVYLDNNNFNMSLVKNVAKEVGRASEAYGEIKKGIQRLEESQKNFENKVEREQTRFANKNNAPKDRADAFVELLTAENSIKDNTKVIEEKTTALVEQEQKIKELVPNYEVKNQKVENNVQQPDKFNTNGIKEQVDGLFFNFAKNHVLDKMGEAYEKNKNDPKALNAALGEIKGKSNASIYGGAILEKLSAPFKAIGRLFSKDKGVKKEQQSLGEDKKQDVPNLVKEQGREQDVEKKKEFSENLNALKENIKSMEELEPIAKEMMMEYNPELLKTEEKFDPQKEQRNPLFAKIREHINSLEGDAKENAINEMRGAFNEIIKNLKNAQVSNVGKGDNVQSQSVLDNKSKEQGIIKN